MKNKPAKVKETDSQELVRKLGGERERHQRYLDSQMDTTQQECLKQA